jgi:acyl-CoA dehydrogenase
MGKLLGTELKQFLTEIGVEIAAHYGQVRLPLTDAEAAGIPESSVFAMSAYLNDRAASIYGGTNEVQRNIIATQLLARGAS